jgi:hypothetical protein
VRPGLVLPGPSQEVTDTPWGVAAAVVSVAGGAYNASQQGKAAKAGQKGYDAASAESARQYDQTRADLQPWMQAGQTALEQQQQILNGDYSSFYNSPDYQFAYDNGLKALNRQAIGNLSGGGTSADLVSFGQGLASQNFGNYWNRLSGLSGAGQQSANQIGSFGQQNANNQSQFAIGAAQNRQSAYANQAQNWNQAVNGVTQGLGYWANNNTWGGV